MLESQVSDEVPDEGALASAVDVSCVRSWEELASGLVEGECDVAGMRRGIRRAHDDLHERGFGDVVHGVADEDVLVVRRVRFLKVVDRAPPSGTCAF